ncbi:MAG TPA: serine/threonine-protein kinase [Patescibacteria group bacterium]|nr:serine/threonine-protein kinase [Patescibacteria group bacterium]
MSALNDDVVEHLRAVADLPDLTETRYQVVRKLDRGGMGTVYLVKDAELGRELALKVLSAPDPSGDLAARLVAEARHLARLEHPNIVPVHDVGRLPDGRAPASSRSRRGRRLDAWRAEEPGRPAMLRLFQKICGAVAFAHSQGVIHRDLKPENIMVGSFGEALVLDWGVAKLMNEPHPEAPKTTGATGTTPADAGSAGTVALGMTAQGAVIGTPAYMPPEQASGQVDRVDARSDVYALGAILYFLLAGRPPFEGDSPRQILARVVGEEPVALRRLDVSIPRRLASICAKAMAADPEGRYESAQQMSDDVDRLMDGSPVMAHPETLLERSARILDRNRPLVWLVVAYVLMRMAVLAFSGR